MKLKRILAIALCFAMVLSTMSFNVFASETNVTTEAELSAALATSGTVVLGGDITVEEMIGIPAATTVTLNLNGNSIISGYQEGFDETTDSPKHIYPFDIYGNLTIKDETGDGSVSGRGIYLQNGAKLTVESGSIYGIDSNGGSAIYMYGGKLDIDGGHIEQDAEGTYNFAVNALAGSVTVDDGWIGGNHGAIACENAEVVLNNGTYVCTGTPGVTDNVLYSYGSGSITINNGTFIADNDGPSGGCCVYDSNGSVVVNDGNFSNSSGGDVWGTTGTTIKGGTFENLIETDHVVVGSKITNGGVTYVKTDDGFEVVKPAVATVDDTPYTDLQDALDAAVAGEGNVTVEILEDIDLTSVDWNPVTVSAPKYPVVTVNGNGKTITGLNDMLFAGTWAGGSGLIINDLTIADSAIVNDKDDAKGTVGVGAFIGFPQASATVTLNNCHLVDSSVEGGHWTGGLIGYAAGYAGNDGPVFMNLTIKDCSVTGSTIIGKGSAGGVIGHATGNAWTQVTIADTTVSGNTVTSTGSSANKAGAVIGTIGAAGQATTVNGVEKTGGVSVAATVSDNDVTSDNTTITTIYGRQGTGTGMLYVTGGEYDNYPIEENVAYAAPVKGYEIADNGDGTWGVAVDPAISSAAKIGDTYYATLEEAVAVGGEVVVINDIELASTVVIEEGNTVILNLNGKTISAADTFSGAMFVNNGTLTITGEGTLDASSVEAQSSQTVDNYGTLTIENGTIKGFKELYSYAIRSYAGSVTVKDASVISYFGCLGIAGGEAVIEDGYFETTSNKGGHTLYVSNAEVTVNGGEFAPYNDITDSSSYSAYVSSTGTLTVNGGSFESTGHNQFGCSGASGSQIAIYGGSFDQAVPEERLADGYVSIADLNGNNIVGSAPTATVNDLGSTTVAAGDYTALSGGTSEDMKLSFVMQFLADQDAEDMETSPYADWYADFVLTFTGLESGSFIADDCYLAGYYGSFGWVKVPVDGMEIEEGVRYPVMLGYGAGQKYDYICEDVKDFRCALYLTPEILQANPNLNVELELSVVDNSQGSDAALEALMDGDEGTFHKTGSTQYAARDFAEVAGLLGEGTQESPYLINNINELKWFRDSVNNGTNYAGKFIKLTSDIYLGNEVWTPIGTKTTPFKGTFDGGNNTISNLMVEGEANQGFFGYATEAKINNLILDNVSVKGTDCVGAVVGQGYASTYIDNCKVTGVIKIEGLTNVGGITGKYYARVTNSLVDGEDVIGSYIKGTYKEADLEGDNVGGIMGHAGENNSHANNTVKNITIEGTRKVGGLIGTTDRATDISGCVVENVAIICSATEDYANDKASTTTIGGLIGNYYGDSVNGTIDNCSVAEIDFVTGNAKNVGAIVGGVRNNPGAEEVEGVTATNISVSSVSGTTNSLLVPEGVYAASVDGVRYTEVADAMSKTVAGSTVIIYEGNYEGGLNVNKAITVIGKGEVNFNGQLKVTADGAIIKGVNFNNASSTAGYISAKNVLIEDCEVVGSNGFRSCYTSGTVTFKDSVITGSVYGIHFDGNKDGNIVIDNCKITGWTSFARTITKVTITGTEFETGNYNQLRLYQDAEITDTVFNPDMSVDFGTDEVECNLTNCEVSDGSPLTDVIYLGDIVEMGVNVTIDDSPVKVPASLTKDNETVYCLSIQDALDGANGAGTITVTEDVTENITVNAPVDEIALLSSTESLVLDLNGKTLTGYIYVDYDATIEIKNGTVINYTTGKDTIASFGNITLTDINADGVRHIVRAKNGNVVINSGTYKYTGSENGTRHAVNIGDDEIDTNVATAVIYGGTFIGPKGTAADSGSAVLVQERSKVLVYGGEFSGGKLLTLSAQPDAVLDLRGGTYDQNPSQYVIEPAFAAYKNADGTYNVVADRSLELTSTTDELYEGEEVTIEVVVNGENIAGTSWTLNWNKNYFKPHADENLENTGSVNDSAWTQGHEVVFDDGTTVKEYTFVAIAQDVEVTGQFTLANPCATTHIEAFDGTEVIAGLENETANVTILLRDYEYEKFFDDADVTAVDTASVDFDGEPHTFKIVPVSPELVNSITYKVNDVEYEEVSLTEEGIYTITYKIDGKTGYADYEDTFTIVIDEADFVVEVNPYTDNTELVLVYTNTPKLRFKYDNAVMLDVKAARKDGKTYEYNNVQDDGYAYVYGYVIDVADTSMITYTGDNAEVFAIDSAYVLAQIDEKFDFLADINFSSTLNVQDIVTEYGVAYEHSALLAKIKYQRNLLKADVDGNKVINNDDATFVVGKVKTAMGLR